MTDVNKRPIQRIGDTIKDITRYETRNTIYYFH